MPVRLLCTAALMLLSTATAAQPAADTLVALPFAPGLAFEDARALAVDPFGHLYVADAGRSVVYQLDRFGVPLHTLGGPGTREGAFNGPTDVDPTNGLALYVADAGNGRIQRFSRELAFLEAIPVRRDPSERGVRPSYRRNDPDFDAAASGRPIAVAAGSAGTFYALDADGGEVLAWDADQRFARAIGGFGAGEGALVEPVALAVGPEGLLYVADAGLPGVVVFDAYGGFVRVLAPGLAAGIRNLAVGGDRLWFVLPDRVLVYTRAGRLDRIVAFGLDEPLIDAALHEGRLLLLTARRLYQVAL